MRGWVVRAGISSGLAVLFLTSCALEFKDQEKRAEQQPIHCATARGDLRVLQSEKSNVAEQIAMGATMIYPAGAVIGLLTGTEGTKYQVATGEYTQTIESKIAQIKSTCGIQ